MKSKNILFFLVTYTKYWEAVFSEILNIGGYNVTVVFDDKWADAGISIFHLKSRFNIDVRAKSVLFNNNGLAGFLADLKPVIIYLPGWMDRDYLTAAKHYKNQSSSVVTICGIDDQWHSKIRQYIGIIYYKFFLRKIFDYMWVSGPRQYHYARMFGYTDKNIIFNLLSAPSIFFTARRQVKKRFIFIGRFVQLKNISRLINSFVELDPLIKKDWSLLLVGDGECADDLRQSFSHYPDIVFYPFLSHSKLADLLTDGGVFCMPSYTEAWGVAIHEAAASSLPLLISRSAGASSVFLIHGYNGFVHDPNDNEEIKMYMEIFCSMSMEQLLIFSNRSGSLAHRIRPEYSAYSFISAIK